MTNKKLYEFYIKLIEAIHIVVILLFVAALVHLFLPVSFKLISAGFIISIFLVDLAYGFRCPLTIEENKLFKKLRGRIKGRAFVPIFFKEKFGIDVPENLVETGMVVSFCIAMFFLITTYM